MSEKFDDYKIQEGCTVQPQTKEELVDTMGLVDQIYQDQIDLGPYLPQPALTVKKHKSRGL